MSSSFNSNRPAMQTLTRCMGSLLLAAAVSVFLSHGVWAQQNRNYPGNSEQGQNGAPNTELTIRNLSRVAASATQIRAVLVSNPGLVVELQLAGVAEALAGREEEGQPELYCPGR